MIYSLGPSELKSISLFSFSSLSLPLFYSRSSLVQVELASRVPGLTAPARSPLALFHCLHATQRLFDAIYRQFAAHDSYLRC